MDTHGGSLRVCISKNKNKKVRKASKILKKKKNLNKETTYKILEKFIIKKIFRKH